MRGINLQVDRGPIDPLIVTCNPRRLRFNLPPYLVKVVISSPWLMQELSKLGVFGTSFRRVGIFIRQFVGWYIDEL